MVAGVARTGGDLVLEASLSRASCSGAEAGSDPLGRARVDSASVPLGRSPFVSAGALDARSRVASFAATGMLEEDGC